MLRPFHLAIPVHDLAAAEHFYGTVLGFSKGRQDTRWIDWNMYGHQVVTHWVDTMPSAPEFNNVDAHAVPVPHFGVVLTMDDWQALADRLTAADIEFVIAPYIRFKGEPGEQATLFFMDPSGNALEFKAFRSLESLFATA